MGKKLYGHVTKDNLQYEWKSEPGACKVCQAMDGTIYDSANDIPDRPHPNCKCWIDVLEKNNDEKQADPFEIRKEIYKDKRRRELELGKLLGDAKSLEEEVDEYLRHIESKENEFSDFEKEIGDTPLEPIDRQKLSEIKEKLDYAKYKGQNVKQKIESVKNKIENTKRDGNIVDVLDKLYYQLKYLKDYANSLGDLYKKISKEIEKEKENILVKFADRNIALIYGLWHSDRYNMPEAYNLFKVAVNSNNYNRAYLNKNGKLFNSINDLNNTQIAADIHSRIKAETPKGQEPIADCKVLVLNPDSSIAKSIEQSYELKHFINENIEKLKDGEIINQKTIEFKK